MHQDSTPKVVLLCHHDDRIDREGLSAWLASTFNLAGIVVIQDGPERKWRSLRAERRRTGWIGAADAIAFRAFYHLTRRRRDAAWIDGAVTRLRARYPASTDHVPQMLTSRPNSAEVQAFIRRLEPDLVIARCKHLLVRDVFALPRAGTVVFHPGICPEYRNAHGCFWALVNRDRSRVGMTLLKIDSGVDTGAVFFHGHCPIDEERESHIVLQYRAVIENLEPIARVLTDLAAGRCSPISTAGRRSAVWGQPRLSAYLGWRRAVRRESHDASHLSAVS
jgi:folate-dependent phosphoribosylglycinamide formyltransferase PurN